MFKKKEAIKKVNISLNSDRGNEGGKRGETSRLFSQPHLSSLGWFWIRPSTTDPTFPLFVLL